MNEEKEQNIDNSEEIKNDNETNSENEQNDIEDINENSDESSKELQELKNKFLRLQADFSNFKKRNEKEKESLFTYAKTAVIGDILTVLDNFERAFTSVEEDYKENAFYKGMELVYKQLIEALTKNGMEEIEALNNEFDPNFHHAVMQEESEDQESDIVTEVFQKGYKLNDKVIRPSMVKVSK